MANEQGALKLTTGRTIGLRALDQRLVYEGLLEGLPTRERNRQKISSYLEQARQSFWGKEPFLVPPSTETAGRVARGASPTGRWCRSTRWVQPGRAWFRACPPW